ncbi:hypothetical protein BSAE_1786 [Bifidobacterium pullorum subsp. saeculare DSM 6531 = LMG 14934]|uniref:Uncharacterized protein n=1 Tax=Bifidobacterium pullorum subsp. saeculare DSM 6531 = LMG 14934 TaxID=1437611 RepID=A0A087CXZ9_9BIFI|nr:hypothetical protein BSAE_1786 [Bifidobacterium pullorum subsp. saeculare DSM 6531 = LMG 14934]
MPLGKSLCICCDLPDDFIVRWQLTHSFLRTCCLVPLTVVRGPGFFHGM